LLSRTSPLAVPGTTCARHSTPQKQQKIRTCTDCGPLVFVFFLKGKMLKMQF
jgi:hypothetical protein